MTSTPHIRVGRWAPVPRKAWPWLRSSCFQAFPDEASGSIFVYLSSLMLLNFTQTTLLSLITLQALSGIGSISATLLSMQLTENWSNTQEQKMDLIF